MSVNITCHLDRSAKGEYTWMAVSEPPGYTAIADSLQELEGLVYEAMEEFFPREEITLRLGEPTLEW